MGTPRSYHQHCGIARALDILGERWTLLILRELLLGPRRYGDLASNLPGVGTNLLAARLRSLEEAGIVRRATLPPPANVPVYDLTARGEALRPILADLALWGYDLLPEVPAKDDATRASWAAMSMAAVLERSGDGDLRGVFAFAVGDEVFHVDLTDEGARVVQGVPATADVRVTADPMTFFALADRRITAARAVRDGVLTVDGDRRLLERLLAGFHLPERVAA